MKKVKNVIILIAVLIVVITGVVTTTVVVNKQTEIYNNGYHQTCNGKWVLTTGSSGAQIGVYTYTCDKCHKQFTSWWRFQ